MFFDDVVVPAERVLGDVNGGWAVAMSILPYERSSCFWQRDRVLYRRLERVVEVVPADDRNAEIVGNAYLQLHALRPITRHAAPSRRRGDARGGDVDRQDPRRDRGSTRPTTRCAASCPAWCETGDGAEAEMWRNEYLVLAGRDHLRRDRRSAAQHRCPPAARPR